MKKISYGIFLTLCMCIMVLIPDFSYAECSACFESPDKFQQYIDVMKELINYDIPSSGSTGAVVETKDRFERARQVAQQHLADIVPQIQYAQEGGEIKLLEQTKIRTRDYDKLLDLDEKILLKLGEFGLVNDSELLNGGNMESQVEAINSLLKQLKFIELTRFNDGYTLSQLTYVEYLGMLWRLNGLIKYLHRDRQWFHFELYEVGKGTLITETEKAQDAINSVEIQYIYKPYNDLVTLGNTYVTRNTSNGTNSPQVFTFTDDYKQLLLFARGLQRDYECTIGARGLCGLRKDAAESSWKQVKDRWKDDGGRAVDTFERALGRFRSAFWGDTDDTETQQHQERINEYRGDNIPRKKKRREAVRIEGEEQEVAGSPMSITRFTRSLFENEKERNERIEREGGRYVRGERVSSSVSDQPKSGGSDNPGDANTDEKRKALLDTVYVGYFDKRERQLWSDNRINTQSYFVAGDTQRETLAIQNTMIGVLNLQRGLTTTALANDVSPVTKQFPNLSDALYRNSTLRGDKHDGLGNNPSIYPAVQTVCTNQCSNITDKQCGAEGE